MIKIYKIKNSFLILCVILISILLTGCNSTNFVNQKANNGAIIKDEKNENKINSEDKPTTKLEGEPTQIIMDKKDIYSKTIHKIFQIRALSPSTEVYELNINIPVDRYNYYKNNDLGHNFDKNKNIALWATPEEQILKDIAEKLRSLEEKNRNFYFINSVFEIIKSIKYVNDYTKDETGEYWNFPIETLIEGKGDCEDMSFLTAGLFGAIGWDVILTGLPGHMAMAIEMPDIVMKSLYNTNYIPFDYYSYKNKKYYYVETTNLNDFKFSQIPQEYKKVIPNFYSVINQDLLSENITIPMAKTSQWKTFTSIEDNFEISFPSTPQIKKNYYRTARYNTYEICADEVCYLVSVSEYNNDSNFVPTTEQASELALSEQPDSELITLKEIISNGYPAHDFLIKNKKNIYTKEKDIYASGILYQIRASYAGDKCAENNCNQFFDSFRLIK